MKRLGAVIVFGALLCASHALRAEDTAPTSATAPATPPNGEAATPPSADAATPPSANATTPATAPATEPAAPATPASADAAKPVSTEAATPATPPAADPATPAAPSTAPSPEAATLATTPAPTAVPNPEAATGDTSTDSLKKNASDNSDILKYSVLVDSAEKRFIFGLYGGLSQFQRSGVALMGYTIEVMANYALTDKIATQIAVAQAISLDSTVSVLFTGIRLAGSYAILGDFSRKDSTVVVNGLPTFTQSSIDNPVLAGELGIDQYMFNGEDRIVPGTGISLGARYDRNLWGVRTSFLLRYGALLISQESVQMLTTGVGFLLRF